MDLLNNNYFILLAGSNILFFFIGVLLGALIMYNFHCKEARTQGKAKKWNADKLIKQFIIIIVSVTWLISMLIEAFDSSFTPSFLLHLIFGMVVGSVLDINFGEILTNFIKVNRNVKAGDQKQNS